MAPTLAIVLDYLQRAAAPSCFRVCTRSNNESAPYQPFDKPALDGGPFHSNTVSDEPEWRGRAFLGPHTHAPTLSHLSVWAYFALGFVLFSVVVVVVYAVYSCWGANVVRVREGGGVVCGKGGEMNEVAWLGFGSAESGIKRKKRQLVAKVDGGVDSFGVPFVVAGSMGDPKLSPIRGSIVRPEPVARR